MNMHFKLGLYEHQSAGAIDGLIGILSAHPELIAEGDVENIKKI
jgi:2-methylcitrate dehydratase